MLTSLCKLFNSILVWGDVLKKLPWIMKIINHYFSVMQSMHCGKSATIFKEKAEELGHKVLTNKKYQTTRFVRSLQRVITTALRNLPTIVAVIAEEYNGAASKNSPTFNNTRAVELKPILDSLRNAEILFFTIGMAQILEGYCAASLEAQHSTHFPIQVCTHKFSKIDSVIKSKP